MFLLSVFFLFLGGLKCDSLEFRGLSPDLQTRFQARLNTLKDKVQFCCLDNSRCVPFENVNDDFCDCHDGSDEIGTSACTGVQRDQSRFYCTNEGFLPKLIPRWKVNDGICDCCDGSDELPTPVFPHSKACPNTCDAEGKAWRTEQARLEAERKKGLAEFERLAKAGAKQRAQWELEEGKLRANSLDALRQQISDLKNKKVTFENRNTPAPTAVPSLDPAVPVAGVTAPDLSTPDLSTSDLATPDLSTPDLPIGDSPGTEQSNVVGANVGAEDPAVSEYAQWMETDDGEIDDDDAEEFMESSERVEEENVGSYNSKEIASWRKWIDGSTSWFTRRWNAHFNPPENGEQVNQEIARLSQQLTKQEEQLQEIETNLGLSAGHFYQFLPLLKTCVSKNEDKYVYEICFLGKAIQKEGPQSTTLGQFSNLEEMKDEVLMHFTGGTYCWGGPHRSLTVAIRCGGSDKLLSVAESQRCVYSATMSSPAACNSERFEKENVAISESSEDGSTVKSSTDEL